MPILTANVCFWPKASGALHMSAFALPWTMSINAQTAAQLMSQGEVR
jgi:hypothetical protein